jgi:hypothetical protein
MSNEAITVINCVLSRVIITTITLSCINEVVLEMSVEYIIFYFRSSHQ